MPPTKDQIQFLTLLRGILERSYADGIDRFLDIEIANNGDISGMFRDDDRVIEFKLTSDRITTKLVKNPRQDSEKIRTYARWDGSRKPTKRKRQCSIGMSCGVACIAADKTCQIQSKNVASPSEMKALKTLAVKVKNPQGNAPAADPLDSMSIRDLKKEASRRGVYRYSYMNTEQLKSAIRTIDQDPNQEERVRKTLERRKQEREALEKVKPAKYAKTWKDIQKIMKIAGTRPDLVTAAVAAIILGTSVKVYQDLKTHYREGLRESADAAEARAEKLPVLATQKTNITFTIGGFKNLGSTGQRLKDELESLADRPEATPGDKWFLRSNHIIPLDSGDYDVPETGISKRRANGKYNPIYLGYVMKEGFGASMRNYWKQRNEGAVELAAQIYAQARKQNKDGKLVNEYKAINILAHGAGGQTAREALDILSFMPEGRSVLRRVNLVTMGTPDFGFTDRQIIRDMTITSTQDPFTLVPIRNEKRVNTVKGHEIKDYLENDDVIDTIRTQFGYARTSTYFQEAMRERRKATAVKVKPATTKKAATPATPKATSKAETATQKEIQFDQEQKKDSIAYLEGRALIFNR